MTRITGPVTVMRNDYGSARYPLAKWPVEVGDLMVPPIIEVNLPGADGQPALEMVIEVVAGVPRCTELVFRRVPDGREIRQKDLRAIEIDAWVEAFVAACSTQIVERNGNTIASVMTVSEDAMRTKMRDVSKSRARSRRPLTDARLRRVADVYAAQESGGIEAVEVAFRVSRSTAVRYIRAAREAGLIEERTI